jgi:hypothetical protein
LARWSSVGNFVFLAPLTGLAVSMSYSPYLLFVLLCGSYFVVRHFNWAAYVPPIAAFFWLFLVFAGARPLYGLPGHVGKINPARAASLEYRIEALEEYRGNILMRPYLGHAGWSRGRIEDRATDSTALVHSLEFGLIGMGLLFGWWMWAVHIGLRLVRGVQHTGFGPIALGVAVVTPLCVAVSVVDAAFDLHVLVAAASRVGVDSLLRARHRALAHAREVRVEPSGSRRGRAAPTQGSPPAVEDRA